MLLHAVRGDGSAVAFPDALKVWTAFDMHCRQDLRSGAVNHPRISLSSDGPCLLAAISSASALEKLHNFGVVMAHFATKPSI